MKKLLLLAALVGGLSLFASTSTAEAGYGYGGYNGGYNSGYRSGFGGGYRSSNFGHRGWGGYNNNWNMRYSTPGCFHGGCDFGPTYVPTYIPTYGGCSY